MQKSFQASVRALPVKEKRPSQRCPHYCVPYNHSLNSILEYACEAWHYSLPLYLSELLERIQKRALRIIFPSLKYDEAIVTARLDTLSSCCSCLCFRFFTKMNSHKLHDLVPPRRDLEYRLHRSAPLKMPLCRTDCYKNSFIPAATLRYNSI